MSARAAECAAVAARLAGGGFAPLLPAQAAVAARVFEADLAREIAVLERELDAVSLGIEEIRRASERALERAGCCCRDGAWVQPLHRLSAGCRPRHAAVRIAGTGR